MATHIARSIVYPAFAGCITRKIPIFLLLLGAAIPRIALENSQPHGLAMDHIGRYSQIVQPWMFGAPYTKGAALWLKNLPLLVPTHQKSDYEKIHDAAHKMPPGPAREKERSRTHEAVADAFAEQWGCL